MAIHVDLSVEPYDTFWLRLRGLLGRPPPTTPVWLSPCTRVHTFGMRYAIDVVYLDAHGTVLRSETLPPARLGAWVRGTRSVLEMSAGRAVALGLVPGSQPRLIPVKPGATTRDSVA